jgi:hypothetical protein
VRTAILSDLHLGSVTGGDVLRDADTRQTLFAELAGAERLVLLGDVVELRDRPIGAAFAMARPFFAELGAALGAIEVTIVPGNHDHRLVEPLLDGLSLEGAPLALDSSAGPAAGPTADLDAWLGPARLRIAYPGLWLREDVYATHGHYMDLHLPLPRAECIGAAIIARFAGSPPDPAVPADYERVLRPIYGLGFGVAQGRPARVTRSPRSARGNGQTSEAAWELLAGGRPGRTRRRRLAAASARAAFPVAVAGVNRLLRTDFDADISGEAIFRGGVEGATEMARRLGVDGGHVITGHTHRGGPRPGEAPWPLPGGGQLHNTGNWIFSTAFHHPGTPPSPYWPGTVTWVEDEGPPRRVDLLRDRSHEEMIAMVRRTRG